MPRNQPYQETKKGTKNMTNSNSANEGCLNDNSYPDAYGRDCIIAGFVDALKFGCFGDSPHWEDLEIEHYEDLRESVGEAVNTFVGHLTHSDILQARECASWERLGRDLYFTAVGSGSGFWDGHYTHDEDPHLGHRLTESAKLCGMSDIDLYEGDDGKVYFWGI
jgi:hypothetical protein